MTFRAIQRPRAPIAEFDPARDGNRFVWILRQVHARRHHDIATLDAEGELRRIANAPLRARPITK